MELEIVKRLREANKWVGIEAPPDIEGVCSDAAAIRARGEKGGE